jgi:hypothetical protein
VQAAARDEADEALRQQAAASRARAAEEIASLQAARVAEILDLQLEAKRALEEGRSEVLQAGEEVGRVTAAWGAAEQQLRTELADAKAAVREAVAAARDALALGLRDLSQAAAAAAGQRDELAAEAAAARRQLEAVGPGGVAGLLTELHQARCVCVP